MSKVMSIYVKIWPCQVTEEANFEKILFFPNSAFNIEKSCKISSIKAPYFRRYQPKKPHGGGTPLPSAFRVNKAHLSSYLCANIMTYNRNSYLLIVHFL